MNIIPPERFQEFHAGFDGAGAGVWDFCAQCGWRCEKYKVGTLMPGEKAYIASVLQLSVAELEAKYLDRLVTPRGTVDVLKLIPTCPLLDSCYQCTLAERAAKPVLCEVYPVIAKVTHSEHSVDGWLFLRVDFVLDEADCPLVHAVFEADGVRLENQNWKEYRRYYETVGVERLRRLNAPVDWYWIVAQYDDWNFDGDALRRLRTVPVDEYGTFTLEELLTCRV